jgi:hypothetical protein
LITSIFAGVIGLSTAIKIQERGSYKVTIVAEIFPTDPKDARYASHFAVSMAFIIDLWISPFKILIPRAHNLLQVLLDMI